MAKRPHEPFDWDEALRFAEDDFRDRARLGLAAFTKYTKPEYEINWHHRVLCNRLDRLYAGEIKRLMVFMPPRHGKSELVSRRFPAYLFGRNPNLSIIGTSYSADLASRLNRDVQRIMDSPEYGSLFPDTRLYGKNITSVAQGTYLRNSEIFEVVGHTGVYRSAGVGGGITGMGGQIIVIDDPIKNQEEADSIVYRDKIWDWYTSTLATRLEKNGAILVTLTRWHEDDLAGRLLKLMKADPAADQWTVLNLEAVRETHFNADDPREVGDPLWENKYDRLTLAGMKASLGTRVWNALYQQRPSATEGSMVKRGWFKFYKELPATFDEQIQSWDLTFKDTSSSDYAVGQVWGTKGADKYLIAQTRDRMDFPASIQAIRTMTFRHPQTHTKIVEDKANGSAAIATLKREISGLIPYNPKTSKEARVIAVSPDIEAGNVYLPDPSIAPWISDFIDEVCSFPNAAHDDQVDCMTMALLRFRESSGDRLRKLITF